MTVPESFAARCKACAFTWHSAQMAEGLKLIGSCPRCDGELEFGDKPKLQDDATAESAAQDGPAPHMVLGLPRRW